MVNNDSERSFEQLLAELELVVNDLERGELSLANMIDCYAQGMSLIAQCRKILDDAESRIDELSGQEQVK